MNVIVGPHDDHEKLSGGKPAPNQIRGIGQLDTGADWTLLNGHLLGAARRLFPITDRAKAHGPGAPKQAPGALHDAVAISLLFPDLSWGALIRRATVFPDLPDGLLVLVGRDVLSQGVLTYNGREGRFSFTIP